jgi:hypothetical protein
LSLCIVVHYDQARQHHVQSSEPGLFSSRFPPAGRGGAAPEPPAPWIPDELVAEAYQKAASQNILAAVNPMVFPGYFSVCADGQGFGYGNTYPSLDGTR